MANGEQLANSFRKSDIGDKKEYLDLIGSLMG